MPTRSAQKEEYLLKYEIYLQTCLDSSIEAMVRYLLRKKLQYLSAPPFLAVTRSRGVDDHPVQWGESVASCKLVDLLPPITQRLSRPFSFTLNS